MRCYGGVVAVLVGRRIFFESCLGANTQWPWASHSHLCVSVTKQYNLVPVKGRTALQLGSTDKSMVHVWVAG